MVADAAWVLWPEILVDVETFCELFFYGQEYENVEGPGH